MKIKTISIGDEHEAWIVDNSINLSRFVQRRIGEKILEAIQNNEMKEQTK